MQNNALFVGSSSLTAELLFTLEGLAPLSVPVVIRGDSGTGKSIAAKLLHQLSGRQGDLVPFDCPSIPASLFENELFGTRKGAFTGAINKPGMAESAKAGTLWMDEIGELDLACQAKLLKFLDGSFRPLGGIKEVELGARIVATTNRDLRMMVAKKAFREDLLWRLEKCEVVISPLRKRPGDILPLLQHYIKTSPINPEGKIDLVILDESLNQLKEYEWHGNVRQIDTVVFRTLFRNMSKETISTDDLWKTVEEYRQPVAD